MNKKMVILSMMLFVSLFSTACDDNAVVIEAPAVEFTISIDGAQHTELAPGSTVKIILKGNPSEEYIILQGIDRSIAKFSYRDQELDIGVGENAYTIYQGTFDKNGTANFQYTVSDYQPDQMLYFQGVSGVSASTVKVSNIVEIKVLAPTP